MLDARYGGEDGVNTRVTDAACATFRDWLRECLRALEFYNRRGDHYLIREFHKYCVEHGQDIDEASLGAICGMSI